MHSDIKYFLSDTIFSSKQFKLITERLSDNKPIDLWFEPPYGFIVFPLGPGYGEITSGIAIFLVLLPSKILKLTVINFSKFDKVEPEVLFDLIPNGLICYRPFFYVLSR